MCARKEKQEINDMCRARNNERSREWHRIKRHENWDSIYGHPDRKSSNPPPTLTQLRDAYEVRNESPENMIRLGSLMEDLEAAYPCGYKYKYNAQWDYYDFDLDAPWQNGIKEFLRQDPFLFSKYKTLMRYKKLSSDFRDAIGLDDPNPASCVFEECDACGIISARQRALALLSRLSKGSYRQLAALLDRETSKH